MVPSAIFKILMFSNVSWLSDGKQQILYSTLKPGCPSHLINFSYPSSDFTTINTIKFLSCSTIDKLFQLLPELRLVRFCFLTQYVKTSSSQDLIYSSEFFFFRQCLKFQHYSTSRHLHCDILCRSRRGHECRGCTCTPPLQFPCTLKYSVHGVPQGRAFNILLQASCCRSLHHSFDIETHTLY